VLLHSRFRPPERSAQLDAALADPDPSTGTIVVTTQVLEAGVDVSSSTLFTEAGPWSSVVQRAGRCNRDGQVEDARLLWAEPLRALPYDDGDIAATVQALDELEGAATTPPALAGMSIRQARPEHAVLRRRDLVELFERSGPERQRHRRQQVHPRYRRARRPDRLAAPRGEAAVAPRNEDAASCWTRWNPSRASARTTKQLRGSPRACMTSGRSIPCSRRPCARPRVIGRRLLGGRGPSPAAHASRLTPALISAMSW
jgi:hypothetical protein